MRDKCRLKRRGYVVVLRKDRNFDGEVNVKLYEKKRMPLLRIPYRKKVDESTLSASEFNFDYLKIIDKVIDTYETSKQSQKILEDTQRFHWRKLEELIRKQKERG
ncbi:hypothetical protein H1164_03850 [Thermoactinomyces daqus]|uniref:Uncharacterized protein n=1 Tax=Thermoactinomyces daqus TaxID=1329516 RepID=A0A7W1X8H8_9BACL|nr:hypothetical protein [Thermoactinomyces daqus]MBA4542035.1 hypothetical protein [Thermoactinomyces daqus]